MEKLGSRGMVKKPNKKKLFNDTIDRQIQGLRKIISQILRVRTSAEKLQIRAEKELQAMLQKAMPLRKQKVDNNINSSILHHTKDSNSRQLLDKSQTRDKSLNTVNEDPKNLRVHNWLEKSQLKKSDSLRKENMKSPVNLSVNQKESNLVKSPGSYCLTNEKVSPIKSPCRNFKNPFYVGTPTFNNTLHSKAVLRKLARTGGLFFHSDCQKKRSEDKGKLSSKVVKASRRKVGRPKKKVKNALENVNNVENEITLQPETKNVRRSQRIRRPPRPLLIDIVVDESFLLGFLNETREKRKSFQARKSREKRESSPKRKSRTLFTPDAWLQSQEFLSMSYSE